VERTLDVRTPESISFSYELAGLGSRFLALLVDLTIQVVVFVAIFAGLAYAGGKTATGRAGAPVHDTFVESLAIALVVAIVFIVAFGYFIAFEALWNGQTPGKKLLGLRVVLDGGYPIDFGASLIRNLIRVGEQLVGFYALSAVSALLSHENKRLGDLAAGTIVVREARLSVPSNLREHYDATVYSSTTYLTGEERALLARFLERRDALSSERRAEFAAQLAARVRPRVPPELADLPDEALLERL
jgi:uncharacterized RDD family membrane protein YckC